MEGNMKIIQKNTFGLLNTCSGRGIRQVAETFNSSMKSCV